MLQIYRLHLHLCECDNLDYGECCNRVIIKSAIVVRRAVPSCGFVAL